jgi:hypothetical protein
MMLEMEAGSSATLKLLADYEFGTHSSSISDDITVVGSGAYWDTADWGSFNWSSNIVTEMETVLNGSGRNISALIYHNSSTDPSFTIQGVTVNYSIRGLIR